MGAFFDGTCACLVFNYSHGLQIYPVEAHQSHREWIVRSYVVTFAFVLFRWFNIIPVFVEMGIFAERGPIMIRVSWGIPLFITEIILQWNKK